MRNSGRRSREGAAKTSGGGKGNATDGDDDDDDDEEEGEDDEDVAVCAEGTSSGTISVVEAIVKQKVLDEVCSANVLLFCLHTPISNCRLEFCRKRSPGPARAPRRRSLTWRCSTPAPAAPSRTASTAAQKRHVQDLLLFIGSSFS